MIFNRTKKYTDNQLILAYQKDKNKKWVGILYQRYSHLVLGVCLKYLKNKEKAKDATNELFEKLFIDLLNKQIENFKPWLYVVTKNHCLMILRKMKKSGATVEFDKMKIPSSDEELQVKIQREITYQSLEKAIESLKEDQQTCINLFYIKEMSYNQVAEKTGYSIKQVKSALQNGKRNLKNLINSSDEK